MQKKWKIVLGSFLAIAALAAALLIATRGIEAELLEVQPRDIAKTFKEEGQIIAETARPIHALLNNEIIALHVEEGQAVQEGELLAKVSAVELELQLQQLEAQLKSLRGEEEKTLLEPQQSAIKSQELLLQQARQDLEKAETNLVRMKELYEAGGISKKEYEEVLYAVETAAINLELQAEALSLLEQTYSPAGGTREYYTGRKEALQAQIDLLQHQLGKCILTAPVGGTVADLLIREGEIPIPSVPIMSILPKDDPAVEVYVRAVDVKSIETGMEVILVPDRKTPEETFRGTVQRIAPAAIETFSALGLAEQRVKVIIEPAASELPGLFPGYKLDVEFTIDKKKGRLVVPQTALFPHEGGKALWIVREGKAAVQPVETGFESDRETVITQGLKKGDLVIPNPQLEGLKAGKKIILMKK